MIPANVGTGVGTALGKAVVFNRTAAKSNEPSALSLAHAPDDDPASKKNDFVESEANATPKSSPVDPFCRIRTTAIRGHNIC